MGRQRRFYAVDDDHRALLELCRDGGLLAVPYLTPIGAAPTPVSPTEFHLPERQRFFYLLPAGMATEALRFRPMADGLEQRVDDCGSAVIELTPSERRDGVSLPGRIYFTTETRLPWYEPTRRAYERLARYLGKWRETDRFDLRVGPAAAEAVRAGKLRLQLRSGKETLRLAEEET